MFVVREDGLMQLGGRLVRCTLGRAGVRDAGLKREGDGATPRGRWPLRRVLWRPDRLAAPLTRLAAFPIGPRAGWCDAPTDPMYNRPVTLPYAASAERLWRDDGLYDLVVILGHNDDPVVPGAGSAIFLHLAAAADRPTEGCVALAMNDMIELLALAVPGDGLDIAPAGAPA